uniref:Uncharacterized protein n=1 Tax=Cacopsylla melanoneura TaxID=428564 RepID=A0A8D8TNV5_9HEMI
MPLLFCNGLLVVVAVEFALLFFDFLDVVFVLVGTSSCSFFGLDGSDPLAVKRYQNTPPQNRTQKLQNRQKKLKNLKKKSTLVFHPKNFPRLEMVRDCHPYL